MAEDRYEIDWILRKRRQKALDEVEALENRLKAADAEYSALLRQIKETGTKILFASFGLAKEGLDIPRLDRLFLVSPQKDYAVVTQSIGRIARKAEGKNDAVCYDYVDDIQFCENQFKRRKTHYRKAGCIL